MILLTFPISFGKPSNVQEKANSISGEVRRGQKIPNQLDEDTVFKESTNLSEPVRWQLIDVLVVTEFGIIGADSNDLVVHLTLQHSNKQE